MAVATAATNGGGGWVRWLCARERTEEGDELEGVSERDQGAAWRLQASLEGAGEAGGGRGSRRWPRQRRHPSATRAAYWRGEDDRRRWAGPRWAGPVGHQVSGWRNWAR